MIRKILLLIFVLTAFLLINFSEICFAQNAANNGSTVTSKEIPKSLPVLALSRTNLDTNTSKSGDVFLAKLVEDIIVDNSVLVPKNSSVYGVVTGIKKAKRYPLRNGNIDIAINQIETPQGQKISLERREILAKVISPLEKTIKIKVVGTLPPRAAGYGTSIPLGQGTELGSGSVYAISMGASIVAGAASGFIVPDIGRTRIRSSFERAVDSTPIGVVRGFVAKGQDVRLKVGDGIIISFDKKALQLISNQMITQTQPHSGIAQREIK